HTEYWNCHRRWNLVIANFKSVWLTKSIDVMTQNVIQEDGTKTDRNQHIGAYQTKGQQAGNQTTVELYMVKYSQQWRNEYRNKGNLHGNNVLREHGSNSNREENQIFHPVLRFKIGLTF